MEQHPLNKTRLVLKRPEAHQGEQYNIPLLIEARKCVVCNRNSWTSMILEWSPRQVRLKLRI